MKRILIISLCLAFCSVTHILAYQNEPEGFREFKWQIEKKDIPGLKFVSKTFSGTMEYMRSNDSLNFEGIMAKQIIYNFVDDKLNDVTLKFEPAEEQKFNDLKNILISKFGQPTTNNTKDMSWEGDNTSIFLDRKVKEINIRFNDSATIKQRFKNISEFNDGFQKYWDELLDNYDFKTAVKKIDEWLTKEGGDLLESYLLSPDSENIWLTFKGGGMWGVSPIPRNIEQELDSQKVFSVAEALNILSSDPEKFRGKDIFLSACVVDAMLCTGCCDFELLTDPECEELYYKLNPPTPEEVEELKKIPLLRAKKAGEGVRVAQCAVFRGHFFDNGLKPCADGWEMFVIITEREFESVAKKEDPLERNKRIQEKFSNKQPR